MKPGFVTLQPDTDVSWTADIHKHNGNVLHVDGSVQMFSTERLKQFLPTNGAPVRLAVP